jgi:3-oxoadipate enol-lactonase
MLPGAGKRLTRSAAAGNTPRMAVGYVDACGTRLCCEAEGSGEPIVFIHGLGLDMRMWDDQFETLSRDFRVIRYDLRGSGRSELPGQAEYAHAEDLRALLDRLGVKAAHLVGLSMGGWIATNTTLTYPHLVRSLTLVDSALIGHAWSEDWKTRWRVMRQAAERRGPKAANQLWLEHPLFAPARAKPERARRLAEMIGDYSGWHWMNKDMHRPILPPDSSRLDAITQPTLVLVGELDLPDFHTIARALAAGIPGARRAVLPGAGHMANMEAPALFTTLLRDFLGELGGNAASHPGER